MRRNDFFKSLLFSGGSAASRVELKTETLPYTFNSNSYKLRNYRIYGNTVNEESVGDLVTEGEHAGEYCVPVTITNGTESKTNNIYLPEQIRKVGDHAEYVDYRKQKQHRVRKNLVSSYTVTDVKARYGAALYFFADLKPSTDYILTFTVNSNETDFYTNERIFETAQYTSALSGNKKIVLRTRADISTSISNQYNLEKGWIILKNNSNHDEFSSISNVQLRLASIEDDTYEPYIEDTELDITLPAQPTLSGANTLSVGTTVQPSKVYLQGKISEAETVSAEPVQTNVQSLQPLSLDNDDLQLDVMPSDDLQLDVIIPAADLNDIGGNENAE